MLIYDNVDVTGSLTQGGQINRIRRFLPYRRYFSSIVLQFQASVLVKNNSVKSKTIGTLLTMFLQPYV